MSDHRESDKRIGSERVSVDEQTSLPADGMLAESEIAHTDNARFSPDEPSVTYRPNMPDWGAYLRWPLDGDSWICSDDLAVAQELLPSRRVFKREHWDGEFYHLKYGTITIRVRPSLWTQVPETDLSVDQQVELLERNGENDAGIYRIREILYSQTFHDCEYVLGRNELRLAKTFTRRDLKALARTYDLRVGFYSHATPKSADVPDAETLDVGDIFGPNN